MKNKITAVVIALIFLFSQCKKDQQQQLNCPGQPTFVNDVTANIGNKILRQIHEATDGSIHVIATDNNTHAIQFNAQGQFIRSLNLSTFSYNSKVYVYDAYYLVNSVTTGAPGQTGNQTLLGWKQIGFITDVPNDTCYAHFAFDTVAIPIDAGTETVSTQITKVDFAGNTVWSQTFAGSPVSINSLQFNSLGNMYLTTTNYCRNQYLLHINGQNYEVNDTTRPGFSQTDTLLLKNDQVIIVAQISSSAGQVIWQQQAPVHQTMVPDAFLTSTALNNMVVVSYANRLFKFSSAGSYLGSYQPVYAENSCSGLLNKVWSTYDTDGFYMYGSANAFNGVRYLARLDNNGSVLWQTSINVQREFTPLNPDGFIEITDDVSDLFDGNGMYLNSINWRNLIKSALSQNAFIPAGTAYSCASCNSQIITTYATHINNIQSPTGYDIHTWLIRTNGNGEL